MSANQLKQTWPIVHTDQGPKVKAYNRLWDPMWDGAIELAAYNLGITPETGGLGKYEHLKRAYLLIWPERAYTYNKWTAAIFRAHCEGHKVLGIAGGAGTGKSDTTAALGLLFYWSDPANHAVIVASTTLSALMKRIWSYVAAYRNMAEFMPGHLSNAQPPKILADKKDPKHGIHGFALKEGSSDRVLSDAIGIHPRKKLLWIVDEATDVNPAVDEIDTNASKSVEFYQRIMIGNSKSRMDPHGRACEPIGGWDSVDADHDSKWETKRGACIYFDCYQSPAIEHPEDPDFKKFLITQDEIDREMADLGPNHPRFWRFVRGFWPEDDAMKTILTAVMIDKHNARGKAEWSGRREHIRLAACDPAFTADGDNCPLRFATLGEDTTGKLVLQFDEIIQLEIDGRKGADPISYQIVRLCREHCQSRGIPPKHFAFDSWGFGSGASDILEMEWSNEIHKVTAIGHATDLPTQMDNESKPAHELFANRITELWFMMQKFVMSGQIRGLDEIAAKQFCTRTYEWKGRKMNLESKPDYKTRMGYAGSAGGSPDEADAATLILDLARHVVGFTPGRYELTGVDNPDNWQSMWEEQMDVYEGLKSGKILTSRDFDPDGWDDNFLEEDWEEEL